jgi:enoyl-CoA hydratase/carnithine racemase
MTGIVSSASSNGVAPPSWSDSWTHLRVDRRTPSYCRVTFDHPPVNAITATTIAELGELVELMESDADLKVVVFDSANPDFYLTNYDTEHDSAWPELLMRLSRARAVCVACMRGLARGEGIEFVLACDLRFASRERAVLGQFELGTGVVVIADDRLDDEVDAIASRLSRDA